MTSDESVIEQWLYSCVRCSNCKYVFREYFPSCPSGEHFGFETYYASGRIWLAQALYRGELEWEPSLLDSIFACTTCGNCEIQCLAPHSEHIVDMIEELRARAVQEIGGLPSHIRFRENVIQCHNPYGAEHHNRNLVEAHNLPLQAETVYFVGCTSNYRETQIRDATISVLKKAGVDFTVVNEYCCCSPLIRTGQLAPVNKTAQHNVDALKDAGAKRVVTSCSGCYRTLSRDYPKLGIDLGVEVLHIAQLLKELIDKGAIVPKQTEPHSVITYHDPCHLGRHMGLYDEPRDIISKLPVDLVEMETTRENAWCCGGGGGAKAAYDDWSIETARKRIDQALRTGAELIVSTCPFCTRNLRDGSSEDGLPVIDLTELVDQFI